MRTTFLRCFGAANSPLGEAHCAQPATPSIATRLAHPMRRCSRGCRGGALTLCAGIALALQALVAATAVATAHTRAVFPESGVKGCYPDGTLFRHATGALYGATLICGASNQGTVFALTPPAPGRTR